MTFPTKYNLRKEIVLGIITFILFIIQMEFLLITFAAILLMQLFCLEEDIIDRKISKKTFKELILYSIFINICEIWIYGNLVGLILLKIIYMVVILTISIFLFEIKLLGGGDGKLIIIIFFTFPVRVLSLNLITGYFSNFFCSLCLFLVIKLIINTFSNRKYSFNLYFKIHPELSFLKKFFLKLECDFLWISDFKLFDRNKVKIKSIELIFNFKKGKIYILTQKRLPLIFICMVAYMIELIK